MQFKTVSSDLTPSGYQKSTYISAPSNAETTAIKLVEIPTDMFSYMQVTCMNANTHVHKHTLVANASEILHDTSDLAYGELTATFSIVDGWLVWSVENTEADWVIRVKEMSIK